jgi:hypothetical protein
MPFSSSVPFTELPAGCLYWRGKCYQEICSVESVNVLPRVNQVKRVTLKDENAKLKAIVDNLQKEVEAGKRELEAVKKDMEKMKRMLIQIMGDESWLTNS